MPEVNTESKPAWGCLPEAQGLRDNLWQKEFDLRLASRMQTKVLDLHDVMSDFLNEIATPEVRDWFISRLGNICAEDLGEPDDQDGTLTWLYERTQQLHQVAAKEYATALQERDTHLQNYYSSREGNDD